MDTWNVLTVQTASSAISTHDMNASFRRRNLMVSPNGRRQKIISNTFCIHPMHRHHNRWIPLSAVLRIILMMGIKGSFEIYYVEKTKGH